MSGFLQTKTIMIGILSLTWWIYSNDPTVSFYFPETLFRTSLNKFTAYLVLFSYSIQPTSPLLFVKGWWDIPQSSALKTGYGPPGVKFWCCACSGRRRGTCTGTSWAHCCGAGPGWGGGSGAFSGTKPSWTLTASWIPKSAMAMFVYWNLNFEWGWDSDFVLTCYNSQVADDIPDISNLVSKLCKQNGFWSKLSMLFMMNFIELVHVTFLGFFYNTSAVIVRFESHCFPITTGTWMIHRWLLSHPDT